MFTDLRLTLKSAYARIAALTVVLLVAVSHIAVTVVAIDRFLLTAIGTPSPMCDGFVACAATAGALLLLFIGLRSWSKSDWCTRLVRHRSESRYGWGGRSRPGQFPYFEDFPWIARTGWHVGLASIAVGLAGVGVSRVGLLPVFLAICTCFLAANFSMLFVLSMSFFAEARYSARAVRRRIEDALFDEQIRMSLRHRRTPSRSQVPKPRRAIEPPVPFIVSFVRFSVNAGFIGVLTAERLLRAAPGDLEFSIHLFILGTWALLYRTVEYTHTPPLVPVRLTVLVAVFSVVTAVVAPSFAMLDTLMEGGLSATAIGTLSGMPIEGALVHMLWTIILLSATFAAGHHAELLLSLRPHIHAARFAEQLEVAIWGALMTAYTIVLTAPGILLLGLVR